MSLRILAAGVLAAAVLSCSPQPRWVAVAGDSASTIILLGPDLSPRDTVEPAAGSWGASVDLLPSPGGLSLYSLTAAGDSSVLLEIPILGEGGAMVIGRVPGAPSRVTITPGARHLLILAGGALHIRDPRGRGPPGTAQVCRERAVGVSVLREADRAYVTCSEGAVVELNLRLRRPTRAVTLEACGPGAPALSRNETVLFVPCTETGTLLYLDRARLAPYDSVSVAPGLVEIMLSRQLNRALATGARDSVALVDVRSRRVYLVAAPGPVLDAALSGDGRRAYVLVSGAAPSVPAVHELDLATAAWVASRPAPDWAKRTATWPGDRTPVMWWRR